MFMKLKEAALSSSGVAARTKQFRLEWRQALLTVPEIRAALQKIKKKHEQRKRSFFGGF